jgi:hypothetical protein
MITAIPISAGIQCNSTRKRRFSKYFPLKTTSLRIHCA